MRRAGRAPTCLGTADDGCIVFGANMTTMTFALSRAIATHWKPGDEVIVTRLDHDANVSPWVRAAADRGAIVRHVDINAEDCTLDLDDFRRKLSSRTKLVAVGCASNAVGTRNPFPEMIRLAHEVGALVFLDAVHYAPHLAMDVTAWDCDFLCCSAYKFFGPHVGVLYGKRALLEGLPRVQGAAVCGDAARPLDDGHAELRGHRRGRGGDRIPGRDRQIAGRDRQPAGMPGSCFRGNRAIRTRGRSPATGRTRCAAVDPGSWHHRPTATGRARADGVVHACPPLAARGRRASRVRRTSSPGTATTMRCR